MSFDGLTPLGLKKVRDRQVELAYRLAYLMEDIDPYGFLDGLENNESMEDGIEKSARYNYELLTAGEYAEIRSWFDDIDLDNSPELKLELDSIFSVMNWLERLDNRVIATNHLKIKRRG